MTMTETTTLLNLSYIMPSLAQKHVTHNKALRMLDPILHIRVENSGHNGPLAAPTEGQHRLLTDKPIGAFTRNRPAALPHFRVASGGYPARSRIGFWGVRAPGVFVLFDGTKWHPALGLWGLPQLGINAKADEVTRLSVAAPTTLPPMKAAGGARRVRSCFTRHGPTAPRWACRQ